MRQSRGKIKKPSDSAAKLLARVPEPWKTRFRRLGRAAVKRPWPLCLVGGCVRDLLLKQAPLDWDITSEGPVGLLAREAATLFSARLIQHPAFLTYTLEFPDGTSLDIATARRETYPHPAALPVVEPAALADDFQRRDFTINAVAVHLTPAVWGKWADPFNGREDIRNGLVRVLHDKSFEDDPTRLYRAARYAGRYGWKVESRTEELIVEAVRGGFPERLSPARLRHELERLVTEKDPRPALKMLWQWGAWTFWKIRWAWTPWLSRALGPSRAVFRRGSGNNAEADLVLHGSMALCRALSPEEAEEGLRRLEFPRATIEAVTQSLRLLRLLEEGKMDFSQTTRLSTPVQSFLKTALTDPRRLDRWVAAEPLLKGEDLRGLGYAPGPLYQEIFRSLREARWEGRTRSRADEIRHVLATFPREKTVDP